MKQINHKSENSFWLKLCEKGIPGIVMAVVLGVFIQLKYQYHFFLKEQISFFAFDGQHILSYLNKPSFFSKLVADFISQFFYLRGTAAIIVPLLFLILYFSIKKVIQNFSDGPLGGFYALFPTILIIIFVFNVNTDLTYFISFLLMLLLFEGYSLLPSKWWRSLVIFILIPFLYAAIGGLVSFLGILIFIYEIKNNSYSSLLRRMLTVFILIFSLLVPLMFRYHYAISLSQAFLYPVDYKLVSLGWILAPLFSLLIVILLAEIEDQQYFKLCLCLVSVAFIILIVFGCYTHVNLNLEKLLALDSEWYFGNIDKIYELENKYEYKSSAGAYYCNLAHAARGELADRFFDVHQTGPQGLVLPISNKGSYLPIIFANEVYFYLGDVNASQHLALLAMIFSPNHYSSRLLRRLIQVNVINEEYKIAEKYLKILEKTLFHKKWAHNLLLMLNDNDEEKISCISWVRDKRLNVPTKEDLRQTNDCVKAFELLLERNPENLDALHYKLCYHLLGKEVEAFANTFFQFQEILLRVRVPKLYQEALVIYYINKPDLEIWSQIPVKPAILKKFIEYNNLYVHYQGEGRKLEKNFKNTYWFYYHYAKAEKEE